MFRTIAQLARRTILPFLLALFWPDVSTAQPIGDPPGLSFRVYFDQRGELQPSSVPVVNSIVAALPGVTDLFLFSHGWNNDPTTAERAYSEFIQGMVSSAPTSRLPSGFKPILVGIYWPSALFPVSNCRGVIGDRSQFDRWAQAAFPLMTQRTEFQREVSYLYQSVFNELTAGPVGQASMLRSVEILTEWALIGDGTDPDNETGGEASILARSASNALRFYQDTIGQNREVAQAGGFSADSVCGALNVLTFWTMKRRAGNVGARGGYDLLSGITQAGRSSSVHIHLIGHSFGTKLLSAALLGVGGQPNQNRVASFTLIQGAFSHFGFASTDQLQRFGIKSPPGLYAQVIKSGLVSGYIAATYSGQDLANTVFYPLGAAVVQDYLAMRQTPESGSTLVAVIPAIPGTSGTAFADQIRSALPPGTGSVPKYGAIGANGIQGPSTRHFRLTKDFAGNAFSPDRAVVLNVNATDVITGHSEYFKPEVYRLVWDLVLASR